MTSLAEITPDTQEGTDIMPLRVAICGEVNSGKSTVVNAILKGCVLPDLFGGKTRPFIHIRQGDTPSLTARYAGGDDVEIDAMSSEALQEAEACALVTDAAHFAGLEIIEVPFLNERTLTDEQVAFVESADLLVWTTIASQAWRLSEKSILDRCEKRSKAAVLVVSRADKLRSDADREKLMNRMQRETSDYFREIVMMHGKDTVIEAAAEDDETWQLTGAPALLGHLQKLAGEVRDRKAAAIAAVEALADEQHETDDDDQEPFDAKVVPLSRPRVETGLGALADAVQIAKSSDSTAKTVEDDTAVVDEESAEPVEEELVIEAAEADDAGASVAETVEPVEPDELTEDGEPPVFTAIPDTPRISDAARRQIETLLPALHGCSAVGLSPLGDSDEVEFFKGDAADWAEIGPACKAMYAADARLGGGAPGETIQAHVTLRGSQLLTQNYPRKGLTLFMIAPSARMNHALARTAFQRLTRTLEQTR